MDEESVYQQGRRAAYVAMLRECLHSLGYDEGADGTPETLATRYVAWILERERAIVVLRDLCAAVGDNDWPDTLDLGDIIEKHLARHLNI